MYPVSEAYIDAINARTRTTRMSGVITLSNSTTVNISDADIVQGSLYIIRKSVSGNVFDVGSVVASEMGLSLLNYGGTAYALSGASIALSWGIAVPSSATWADFEAAYSSWDVAESLFADWNAIEMAASSYEDIPLGVWRVDDAKRKQRIVAVKAYDGMMQLDKDLVGVAKTGTPYVLVASLCARCGVTLGTTSAQIVALPNGTMTVTVPDKSSIETCRDLLMWIAQLTGTFGCIDRAGALALRPHGQASSRSIGKTERISADVSDDTVLVTRLAMVVGGVAYIRSAVMWDGLEATYNSWDELEGIYQSWEAIENNAYQGMQLEENPLLTGKTETEINAVLSNLLGAMRRVSYHPASIEYINDPALDCGDIVTLADTGAPSGLDAPILITGGTWRYRGKHTLSAADKPSFDEGALPVKPQNEKRINSIYSGGGGGGTKIHISSSPPDESLMADGDVWLQYMEV